MNKILCPIDFSNTSLNAIEYAVRIAEKNNAILTLLYVFTEEDFSKILEKEGNTPEFDELMEVAKSKLRKLADEIKAESKKNGLVDCFYYLKTGELEENIINFAKEEKYNLIVMGTTGVSDVTEAFVGSNTVKVIESTTCPVLCVPEKASYNGFKKVVYATDYQFEDKIAIQQFILLLEKFNPQIKVLHIGPSEKLINKAVHQDYKKEIESYVNYNLDFVYEVYDDEVNLGIDRFMIRGNGDLLVLLTKQRNFFEKLFHDSLSKKMSYFTDYPLLVYTATS
jgi:nucleotide-binding universal stress UspA family protein